MFLWMLPHLAFFSTSRFRTPIDFGLVILSIDFGCTFMKIRGAKLKNK